MKTSFIAAPLTAGLELKCRTWRRAALKALCLRLFAVWLGAMLLLGVADFFSPMESIPRLVFVLLAAFGTVTAFVVLSRPIRKLGHRATAARIDEVLGDKRHRLLTAYELSESSTPEASDFLISKQVAEAKRLFPRVLPTLWHPAAEWRTARRALLTAGAAALLVVLLNPGAAFVICARLVAPLADIPPYSPLRFHIEPEEPRVVYGGDLEMRVRIDGGLVAGPVRLLTRSGGEIQAVECFRGNGQEFSQRLEKVVDRLDVAFATGVARSKWLRVAPLLEPRFALARFSVTPPAHTGGARRDAVLGGTGLRGVVGSSATLVVTSNRPLSAGLLRMRLAGSDESLREIAGRITGLHTVEFDWMMRETVTVEVTIRDVQGTQSPEPLIFEQQVGIDEKPRLSLTEPGAHVLATPKTVLPVAGWASDDFGIDRVDLVRGMPGFRERARRLAEDHREDDFRFENRIDLGALGVNPGDIIEIYLEGRDYNPALTGINASEVNRIEVIDEEEYARRLRNDITLEELTERLREINSQMEAARQTMRKTIEKLEDATQEEDARAAMEEAAGKVLELANNLEKFSGEFPAFEIEKVASEGAKESASILRTAAERIRKIPSGENDQQSATQKLKEVLQSMEEGGELEKQTNQAADDLEAAADLLQSAAEFSSLTSEQRSLARRADRANATEPADTGALGGIGERQKELRDGLEGLSDRIRQGAKKLPAREPFESLARDGMDFADALDAVDAGAPMETAVTGAKDGDSKNTSEGTSEAADRLESLLQRRGGDGKQPCKFAGLMLGCSPGSGPMGATLGQLGESGPQGAAFSDDGYAVRDHSAASLPVYGPLRTRTVRPIGLKPIQSLGSRRQGSAGPSLANENTLHLPTAEQTPTDGPAPIDPRRSPEKYRDAVRRYFSLPENEQTPLTPANEN